jgi:chromatin remodeling complex protein RSC6
MPPKKTTTKAATAPAPAAPAPQVATPAPKPKQTRKPKVQKEAVEEVPVASPQEEAEGSQKKGRREITRESVEAEFNAIIELISTEIETIRNADKKTKVKGVRFLRQINKRLKSLRADTLRVVKQRRTTTRSKNTSSGFMKAVTISPEMARFTGWNPAEPRSRVEVTKFLCDYIKQHNLQNPADRRQILPDEKLRKLLNYDEKKEGKPLTYYSLQQKIQPHFTS